LAVLLAIVGWWLSQQGLMTKPWLEESPAGDYRGVSPPPLPAAKIGLGIFLAVASALFVLLISAYAMRMNGADWRPLPQTNLLWINTGVLILSSAALQWTVLATHREDLDGVRLGLLVGGASAIAFIAGQLLAWQQLMAEGYFVASNPANSFFYLLTAVHGLHVLGGVAALGRTGTKVWRASDAGQVRLSVELCAVYWHFLLLVWLLVFGILLLTGTYSAFSDWIYSICFGGAS
jgi:cytochrome c oxidase subunit 3